MKPSHGDNVTIQHILQAFFQLDPRTQQQVREQVRRLSEAGTSEVDRNRAEEALARILRSAGSTDKAGRVLSRAERFSPAQQELRAQLEEAETTFASTLSRLMAERQLTQAQLAERVGVGQSAISMLLKRQARPQRRTLGKLAAALGVPVETLWPGFDRGWRSGIM